jgi:endoglucanase
MEAELRVCGAALTASLLAATMLATPTSAETFIPFHSGVNLSVAPGGANSSSEPLDVLQAVNVQRLDEAADIGFDFLRLRVALAPWTDTGSSLDQQRAVTLANEIIQQALTYGMRVDVVMMAGSLPTTTAAGLICAADPSAVAAWTEGWQAVLALLPDSTDVAFEPLNEPPNCAQGIDVWDDTQLSLYHQVRALRRAVKFVVYGHHWGDDVGADFTSLDPTPYLGDPNVLFTFHYYDPFAFTGQGLSWLLDGRYRYLTGLTWPYDAATAQTALANALELVEQDPNLTPDQSATFESELTADIASYATSGTSSYLTAQFAKAQSWARGNHVNPSQILVGEYGVAQPSHNTLGDPLPTSPAWFSALKAAADQMGFATAVWDLDSGFGITCGAPGAATLCPAYDGVLP